MDGLTAAQLTAAQLTKESADKTTVLVDLAAPSIIDGGEMMEHVDRLYDIYVPTRLLRRMMVMYETESEVQKYCVWRMMFWQVIRRRNPYIDNYIRCVDPKRLRHRVGPNGGVTLMDLAIDARIFRHAKRIGAAMGLDGAEIDAYLERLEQRHDVIIPVNDDGPRIPDPTKDESAKEDEGFIREYLERLVQQQGGKNAMKTAAHLGALMIEFAEKHYAA